MHPLKPKLNILLPYLIFLCPIAAAHKHRQQPQLRSVPQQY